MGRPAWDITGAIDRDPITVGLGRLRPVQPVAFSDLRRWRTDASGQGRDAERANPSSDESAVSADRLGRFRLSVSSNRPNPAWEFLVNNSSTNINGWARLARPPDTCVAIVKPRSMPSAARLASTRSPCSCCGQPFSISRNASRMPWGHTRSRPNNSRAIPTARITKVTATETDLSLDGRRSRDALDRTRTG